MTTVWRLAHRNRKGWVRDVTGDHASITGMVAEAHQWDDQEDAAQVAARLNRRRGQVRLEVVEGEATEQYSHGAPGRGQAAREKQR